jgi:ribosome modulation factor
MIATKQTTHPNQQTTSIQQPRTLSGKLTFRPTKSNLENIAQSLFSTAQQRAFDQGISDFENSTRDHPPYGFSDLRQAWKAGWLAASQRADGKRKCAG